MANELTPAKAPSETPSKPLADPRRRETRSVFAMLPPELSHLADAIRSAKLPAGMRSRIIAIDGPGGAGKTSLAEQLALVLDAPIVHTDDFASWDNPIEWWPAVIEKVLRPLAAGQHASYRPTSWGGPAKPEVVIAASAFVILEGVSASRDAFRPYLSYSIWIETSRDVRLRRGLQRDGEHARANWDRWMAEEDSYFEREQPARRADLVLRGDADLWSS